MSSFLQDKVKRLIYPKPHGKNKRYLASTSKSTRADSKNIITIESDKLIDKVGYFDIYSDLLPDRQNLEKYVKKYPKDEEDETSVNSNYSNDKLSLKKFKKPFSQKKAKIQLVKYFKEDGDYVNFPIFKEREVKIDIYDKKVQIESGEDDFLSDDGTIDYGLKKVEKDLVSAFEIIKKENCRCIGNLKRYSKYIDKDKKINLKKNLPFHK